jgi:RimJ/RimL family protein N-acetyltransferase
VQRSGPGGQDALMQNDREPQPTLTGARVRLRPWRADDVDAVFAACQDAEIQRWTQVPVPYAREHAEGFVSGIAAETWAQGGGLFAIEPRDGGPLVGSIGLFPPSDGFAEAGYWTAPGGRRQGYTAEALGLLCAWAFDEVGLRRVELVVDPDNAGSRGVAERAGFRAEGIVRQRFLHRGEPSDVVLYALLATDVRPGA